MPIADLLSNGNVGNIFLLSFSEAVVSGGITNATSEVVAGYIGTAAVTSVTIRGTTYTAQGTDQQRSVSSTSANDTAAGTGARTVRVTYLDAACSASFTETITLNGTTPVNTVNSNIALIQKIEVLTVGALGGNAGTIQLHTLAAGAGSVWGSIAAGDNQTYWAHHYVPVNKTLFITSLMASGSAVAGRVTINVLNPIDTSIVQKNPAGTLRYSTTSNNLNFQVPLTITGPAIVFLNSRPDSAVASTSFGSFGFIQF